MFVKPARNTLEPEVLGEFLHVRDPVTKQVLPPEGAEKPETVHWLRLLRDGDVELVEPSAPPAEEPHPDSKPADEQPAQGA